MEMCLPWKIIWRFGKRAAASGSRSGAAGDAPHSARQIRQYTEGGAVQEADFTEIYGAGYGFFSICVVAKVAQQ